MNSMFDVDKFICCRTVHSGRVEWWFTSERLHDEDYRIRVLNAVNKALQEAKTKYGVEQNTQFCCQWEGVEVECATMPPVQAACSHIARTLARFKGVIPIT